jgi:hypothetical protein
MKVFVFAEHCPMRARVVNDPDQYLRDDGEYSDDITLYGDGDEPELIDYALQSLATRYDRRPGGACDDYRWNCDRNVLKLLNGPDVEYNPKTQVWMQAAPTVEDDCE